MEQQNGLNTYLKMSLYMLKADIIKFPEHYDLVEKAMVYSLLDEAVVYSSQYDGDWTSKWLLNNIEDDIWIINIDGVTKLTNKGYLRAKYIYWNVVLRDGTNLADPKYKKFKNVLQKIGFLAREYGNCTAWRTLARFCRFLVMLARWLFLHQDIYDPSNALLTRIDKLSVKEFIYDYGKGGIVELLKIPQQLLLLLYENALNYPPPANVLSDLYSVPYNERLAIKEWLLQNGLFDRSRHWVTNFIRHLGNSEQIGIDTSILRHDPMFLSFLCQFQFDELPIIIHGKTLNEYPSHKAPLRQEVISTRASFQTMGSIADYWRLLFTMKRHLPDALPDEFIISRKSLWQFSRENSSPPKHTPWVPLKVSLAYTNEALRWVHVYADDLISLYLKVIEYMQNNPKPKYEKNESDATEWRNSVEEFAKSLIIPASLTKLNINTFFSTDSKLTSVRERIRNNPSICDAIEIMIGAIAVLIGFLKPLRESELRNISVDCTELVSGDGYWLNQPIRKKKVGEAGDNDSRPIPYIVARAIELMRKLSDGIKKIQEISDKYLLNKLFVNPPTKQPYLAAKLMSASDLNDSIDAFCDYVNLPTDEYGRRWYIRIHESRKSFLITFFWCFRYSSLDPARWMAMHADASHLYAYIQANFPGEELPALEAEYATTQLWNFENNQNLGETDNVEDLYNEVCNHFKVSKLNLLNEKDIEDWIEIAIQRGTLKIEPYSIKSSEGIEGIRIAFRISKKKIIHD